jgi:hypothetical protein
MCHTPLYIYNIHIYKLVFMGLQIHTPLYIYNKHIYKLGLMGTIIFIYTTYISINYNYPFNAMDLSKATRTGPSAPSAAFPSLHGIESDMQREPCRNGIPQQVSILFWASRCQSCRLYHFIPQIFPPAYQHKQCIQHRCPWVKLTLSSARAD